MEHRRRSRDVRQERNIWPIFFFPHAAASVCRNNRYITVIDNINNNYNNKYIKANTVP